MSFTIRERSHFHGPHGPQTGLWRLFESWDNLRNESVTEWETRGDAEVAIPSPSVLRHNEYWREYEVITSTGRDYRRAAWNKRR